MSSLQSAYINALLADASYVERVRTSAIDADNFKERLTDSQANFLATNFTVLSSIESPKTQGTGFDAVVWQGKAGSTYAGQVFVSMRGTQGLEDIVDDVTLAASGGRWFDTAQHRRKRSGQRHDGVHTASPRRGHAHGYLCLCGPVGRD